MKHYEVVYLVHPDQSEQVPAMREKYRNLIEEEKGIIHRDEDIGRRQLAYPIAKAHKAHYLLMNIECSPDTLQKLSTAFRLNDAVLRYMIVARDKAITEPSVLLKQKDQKKETRAYRPRDRQESEVKRFEAPEDQDQIAAS